MSTGVEELQRSAPQHPQYAPPGKARGPLTGVLWVVLALAIAGGGFAAGRLTAPDSKSAATAPSGDSSSATVSQLLSQALQLHTGGDLDGASALYNEILGKDPQNKYALFNLGQIAQTRGQFDLAIEKYQAAIAVDPKYGPAL